MMIDLCLFSLHDFQDPVGRRDLLAPVSAGIFRSFLPWRLSLVYRIFQFVNCIEIANDSFGFGMYRQDYTVALTHKQHTLCHLNGSSRVSQDYLPKNYDYHVCDFDLIRETGDHVDFKTTFRMVLSSKEDIKLWMKSHAVTWRVDRTYVTKGQKVIFKVDYRCQRNTRPRRAVQVSGHSKNTDCPAMMCVKLFRTQVSRGRQSISTDSHLPTFPTMVSIMNEHNHNIGAPESLPCLVSDIAEYELEVEIGDDYAFAVADGTLSPTPEFSYGWLEDPGAEVVVEDVEQNASEEASHQMAALEFDAMCQKLSEIVKSDESFAAPAAAAVNAFKKIERNPFRIAAALRTFARDPNAGSPSAKSKGRRGAARGKAPSRGRRRLAAERPAEVCAGLDHVYSQ